MVLYSYLKTMFNRVLDYVGLTRKEQVLDVPKITVTIPQSPKVSTKPVVPANTPVGSYDPSFYLQLPSDVSRDKVLASCVPVETSDEHRGIFEPY